MILTDVRVTNCYACYSSYARFWGQELHFFYDVSSPSPEYYRDHWGVGGVLPEFDQRLTVVGWGAYCESPDLVYILFDSVGARTYLMASRGFEYL